VTGAETETFGVLLPLSFVHAQLKLTSAHVVKQGRRHAPADQTLPPNIEQWLIGGRARLNLQPHGFGFLAEGIKAAPKIADPREMAVHPTYLQGPQRAFDLSFDRGDEIPPYTIDRLFNGLIHRRKDAVGQCENARSEPPRLVGQHRMP
jgi:hypothetical protein